MSGAAVALVAGVAAAGYLVVREVGRPVPDFASLAENPDPSLHGTVAYFADRSGCVRIVAAAGRPVRDVLCLPAMDVAKAEELGKETGPQLVWLPDGRLEVTMFRMVPKSPELNAGWQKIVDVRTGEVEDVPAAEVPSGPNLDTRPSLSPEGERIVTSSDPESGRIKVVLSSDEGSRTVLSAQGPPSYTYGLRAAFWAPDGRWIAADDGRILVITPGDAVTRVLTDETVGGGFGGDDPRLARFAVTAENLLEP